MIPRLMPGAPSTPVPVERVRLSGLGEYMSLAGGERGREIERARERKRERKRERERKSEREREE